MVVFQANQCRLPFRPWVSHGIGYGNMMIRLYEVLPACSMPTMCTGQVGHVQFDEYIGADIKCAA